MLDNIQLITYLTSLSREPIMLGSALVACPANHIWFTRALASLDVTVSIDRASRVTVTGLKVYVTSPISRNCSKTNQTTFTVYLTSVSIIHRQSIVLRSTLVTFLASNILFARTLASTNIAVRAYQVTGTNLLVYPVQNFRNFSIDSRITRASTSFDNVTIKIFTGFLRKKPVVK